MTQAGTKVRTEPEPERLEAFMETVLDDFKGHQSVLMCALGERLGLFKAVAEGPATSEELASRAGVEERYVREWLSGLTCAGYIEYDPSERTFWLTPEQAQILATEGTPASFGGLYEEIPAMWDVFEQVVASFRSGGGVGIDAYGDHWWDGMERFTNTWFENFLVQDWITGAEGVHEKLTEGAHVADVGCGRGRALIEIAKAYPEVTAVGYDLSEAQLAGARRNAEEAGLGDRIRFERRDAAQGLGASFDLVTTFDVAHDLADPDAVFAAIHNALKSDGSYLLVDFKVADELQDNIGRTATLFYGWSLVYCMTTALAQGGEALGTCGLSEREVRARCKNVGFSSVDVVPFDHPFNRVYHAKA